MCMIYLCSTGPEGKLVWMQQIGVATTGLPADLADELKARMATLFKSTEEVGEQQQQALERCKPAKQFSWFLHCLHACCTASAGQGMLCMLCLQVLQRIAAHEERGEYIRPEEYEQLMLRMVESIQSMTVLMG
jgi:hypothetical protein